MNEIRVENCEEKSKSVLANLPPRREGVGKAKIPPFFLTPR